MPLFEVIRRVQFMNSFQVGADCRETWCLFWSFVRSHFSSSATSLVFLNTSTYSTLLLFPHYRVSRNTIAVGKFAPCRWLAGPHFLCLSFTSLQQASRRRRQKGKRGAEKWQDSGIRQERWEWMESRGTITERVRRWEWRDNTTAAAAAGKIKEKTVHDVWGKASVTMCTSLSFSDLFYPPSACRMRDEKRLMNNRGGEEMDENVFLFFTSPSFTAPLLPFPASPFFILTPGQKKIL